MTRAPEDRLAALLEAERQVLLSGDLSLLEDSADLKVALAGTVADRASIIPRDRMEGLMEAARRNAALCEAARKGLRGAIDRLAERARVARSLETYTPSGKRRSHAQGPCRLEKRS